MNPLQTWKFVNVSAFGGSFVLPTPVKTAKTFSNFNQKRKEQLLSQQKSVVNWWSVVIWCRLFLSFIRFCIALSFSVVFIYITKYKYFSFVTNKKTKKKFLY